MQWLCDTAYSVAQAREAPPLVNITFVRLSMRIFLDQLVVHAGNIVERHPGPKHLRHDTMFFLGILVDVLAWKATVETRFGGLPNTDRLASKLTYSSGYGNSLPRASPASL